MNDFLNYNELYIIYKDLLTEKQQLYFEEYYLNDLSLSEMAEKFLVSKAFLQKQIKMIEKKLDDYETKLKLKKYKDYLDKNNPKLLRELERL